MDQSIKNKAKEIVNELLEIYVSEGSELDQFHLSEQPDSEVISDVLQKMVTIIFPGFYKEKNYKLLNLESQLNILVEDVVYNLNEQIAIALRQIPGNSDKSQTELENEAGSIVYAFLKKIPKIREYVSTDVQATFDGDPAAFNKNEVILSYPGLYAIIVNRIAHELYELQVPIIPRMMTEEAHSKTGIDIHPGTTLGKYFCIDHGTGIVIGETAIIGEHVKMYQGVTIGALSTKEGQRARGTRRHPVIEDNVTIYSGASILGGKTIIGEGCVIGGNTFITRSIPAGTTVTVKNQELNFRA